jgi:hypothetical protein
MVGIGWLIACLVGWMLDYGLWIMDYGLWMEEEEKSYRLSVISYQWKRREEEEDLSVVGCPWKKSKV